MLLMNQGLLLILGPEVKVKLKTSYRFSWLNHLLNYNTLTLSCHVKDPYWLLKVQWSKFEFELGLLNLWNGSKFTYGLIVLLVWTGTEWEGEEYQRCSPVAVQSRVSRPGGHPKDTDTELRGQHHQDNHSPQGKHPPPKDADTKLWGQHY